MQGPFDHTCDQPFKIVVMSFQGCRYVFLLTLTVLLQMLATVSGKKIVYSRHHVGLLVLSLALS